MIAARLVDDPRGQLALEAAVVKAVLDGDRGLGAPRGAVRHDLGAGPHHAVDVGADQDRAGGQQVEAVGVDGAVVCRGTGWCDRAAPGARGSPRWRRRPEREFRRVNDYAMTAVLEYAESGDRIGVNRSYFVNAALSMRQGVRLAPRLRAVSSDRLQHPRLHVEHRGGEAVTVGHEFAHHRQRRRPRRAPPRRPRRRNRS